MEIINIVPSEQVAEPGFLDAEVESASGKSLGFITIARDHDGRWGSWGPSWDYWMDSELVARCRRSRDGAQALIGAVLSALPGDRTLDEIDADR